MFDPGSCRSAKTPSQDILFRALVTGRNGAECGHSWQNVRTTRTGVKANFGPFFVSASPLSPTQPNHAHFGTDVRSSESQCVTAPQRGEGLQEPRSGGVDGNRTVGSGSAADADRRCHDEPHAHLDGRCGHLRSTARGQTPCRAYHQSGRVRNESGMPIPTIRVTRGGSSLCSSAMIEAPIIGAIAASKIVT